VDLKVGQSFRFSLLAHVRPVYTAIDLRGVIGLMPESHPHITEYIVLLNKMFFLPCCKRQLFSLRKSHYASLLIWTTAFV
jgi:hypothetical protein